MGADLYIAKLPRQLQYTGFRTDVDLGYYRDAYNNSNLLWQFDLSYWTDISKRYCDKEGNMTLENVKTLQAELTKREPIFEKNMTDLANGCNKTWDFEDEKPKRADLTDKQRLEWIKQYRADYRVLQAFLQRAIDVESGLECSL